MKTIKQNFLLMIAAALFAIFAAVVEGSFVYDYDVELRSSVELSDAEFNQNAASEKSHLLSREVSSEAVSLTRRARQQTLSRTLRNAGFQGVGGRDTATFKWSTKHTVQKAVASIGSHNVFPTPLAYQIPKEYYVFTLKRILC
ncbi:hypothetical protein [Fibrobacter sp.]|uniref:hypothetical protein n=1 Tax=Fibrobacter sp. TaxID=35828 RepID=UPI0038692A69